MPYWRLSSFYLFYFATLGIVVPYFGQYLESKHFTAYQIGEIFFMLNITKVVAPFIWGAIADKSGKRIQIIRVAALVAMIVFSGVLLEYGFYWMAIVTMVYSFFWNAALPQFESLTANHLGSKNAKYTRIRLWGSIGFIITVVGMGIGIELFGISIVPYIALIGYLGIFISTTLNSDSKKIIPHSNHQPILQILKKPYVICFFIAGFLLQLSHGPFYAFFSIYLGDIGYANNVIGYLWAVGVVAEVVLFIWIYKIIPKFGARRLLLITLSAASIRWLLIAVAPQYIEVIIISQVLHAATFGISHAIAMYLIHQFFIGKVQGRGQALYTSICMGSGTALGSYLSGMLWDAIGGENVYLLAALVGLISLIIVFFGLKLPQEVDGRVTSISLSQKDVQLVK